MVYLMKKMKVVLILAVIFLLYLMFIVLQDIGAGINDNYKKALLNQYFGAEQTADLNVLDSADFCGMDEDSGAFIIWVGIAVRSDLAYGQLETLLDQIYGGLADVQMIPYDREFANSHGFTGIQKETALMDALEGYYIIGITFEPKMMIDKRNKSG